MTAQRLPADWACDPLRQVADIERNTVSPGAIDPGTTYVGLENMQSDGSFVSCEPAGAGKLRSNKFRFTNEHVLYGKLRPYLKKIANPNFDGICSTDILPIRPKPSMDRSYLRHFLRQPEMVELATRRSSGANLPRVSPKILAEFAIVYPIDVDEQKRIAAILDKADAIRRKRQQAIALTEDLLRSTFLDMFGDPALNPKGWPSTQIGQVADVKTGKTPSRRDPANYGSDVPWVKTGEVVDGVIERTEESLSHTGCEENGLEVFPVGTIIIAMYGQGATRGRSAKLGISAATNQACAAIVPHEGVEGDYLWTLLRLSYDRLRDLGRGGNQPNLNLGMIRSFVVPLPGIDKRRDFVRATDQIGEIVRKNDSARDESEKLFGSLSQRAFRGEL